jgi:hypothetical protein
MAEAAQKNPFQTLNLRQPLFHFNISMETWENHFSSIVNTGQRLSLPDIQTPNFGPRWNKQTTKRQRILMEFSRSTLSVNVLLGCDTMWRYHSFGETYCLHLQSWYLPASPHGITTQNNNTDIFIAMRPSNLTSTLRPIFWLHEDVWSPKKGRH